MTPSPVQAGVIVDELVRCGVIEAVLSPGSWSTPLALALHDHPDVRLHVRIDERSGSFLALGLAKASGRPVPVLCTSGTAAANFHPAVLEADAAGVPLVVLTADRAPELRATGFNQTVDQLKLYGDAVRFFAEVGTAEPRPGGNAYWRSLVGRVIAHATDPLAAGPVHLNLAFRKPFLPSPDATANWPEPLTGRPDGAPWVERVPNQPAPTALAAPTRGVMVLGDGAHDVESALRFAELAGWPVLAEPTSGGRRGPNALSTHTWLLQSAEFVSRYAPDVVITLGKPTLSQGELTEGVLGLVRAAGEHVVVDSTPTWPDPMRTAIRVIPQLGEPIRPRPDPAWLAAWQAADNVARNALDGLLDEDAVATEPGVAREIGRLLPDDALLFVGSSMPIRDLDATMPVRTWPATSSPGPRVLTNRGVSGIDGVVSSALGAALAHQRAGGGPAYALLGDLTVLHDQNGLILGPVEPRPDLTIIVLNNDGGAIFSQLPQGAIGDGFERIFGTPHGVDFAQVAATAGLPYRRVRMLSELPKELSSPAEQPGRAGGVRLVEVRTDRPANADLHARLRKTIGNAVADWLG